MAINELRSVSTFIKAAELGSLRKAALELGISPQAASKALAQLEAHLDARLFHRTTRVMSLTDAGQRLLEDVQPSVLGLQRALLRLAACSKLLHDKLFCGRITMALQHGRQRGANPTRPHETFSTAPASLFLGSAHESRSHDGIAARWDDIERIADCEKHTAVVRVSRDAHTAIPDQFIAV